MDGANNTPISYQHIAEAIRYYSRKGFQEITAPWTSARPAWEITAPKGATAYEIEGRPLVASGEQSFLEMIGTGALAPGCYQCTTPCFRDEPVRDELHRLYFLKTELIETRHTDEARLVEIIALCKTFFGQYVNVAVEESAPGVFDIVTAADRIELGSYGIREHPDVGRWIFATGCAEPRLSTALARHVQRAKLRTFQTAL